MKKILVLLLGSALSFAAPSAAKYVKVGKVKSVTVEKGKSAEAIVVVDVEKGYHIHTNPAAADNLIPTKLEVAGKDGLEVGAPVYPKGHSVKLQALPMEITSYIDKAELKLPITAKEAKAGKYTLEGKLKYQACNDKTCYFPMAIPVSIPVVVK